MRVIETAIKHVDKIFHIGDIHIRNVNRHSEYRSVFRKLYSKIKKMSTGNSLIYVAGDVVHAKTDMSPELVDLTAEFFDSLANICPTIVITGNHDCNLNNTHRLDALGPIIKTLKHENLFYFKDNGLYKFADIIFNVMSVFEKPKNYIFANQIDCNDNELKIALHHGAVNKALTDAGWQLSNEHVTANLFAGHDFTLLGDIHKMQYLDDAETIAYCGSLIQQNHGENLTHGMLVWDLNSKTSEFVKIENDYGYFTLDINNGKIENDLSLIPKKPRLRVRVTNTDSAVLNVILADIKSKYKVQDISKQTVNAINSVTDEDKITFGNVRDVEWQNNIITEYLETEHNVPEKYLDIIRHINRTISSKLPNDITTRNIIWTPKKFTFSNMFSYGETNVIDFTSMKGTYGLFAPNASGKSTLLDALMFCCFDKCSRTRKGIHVLNNKSTQFTSEFEFEIHNETYFIKRTGNKLSNGHVKVNVDFWKIDTNGNHVDLNGDQRDTTNKNIRSYLGTYEDFIITTMSMQTNNTSFIEKSQRERKDLLSQFLDIDVFDQQFQIANDDIKETAVLIKNYNKIDYPTEIADLKKQFDSFSKTYDNKIRDKREHEKLKDELTELIITETKKLKSISSDIKEPDFYESKIKQSEQTLTSLHKEHLNINDKIQKVTLKITELQDKINVIDEDKLIALQREYDQIAGDINMTRFQLDATEKQLSHAKEKEGKLTNHKYDPECEFCMANPWLHETKNIIDTIPFLELQIKTLNTEIDKMEARKTEINGYNIDDTLTMLKKYKVDLNTANDIKSKLERNLIQKEKEIDNTSHYISELTNELKTSIDKLDDIKFNKDINDNIKSLSEEVSDLTIEIQDLDSGIIDTSGKLHLIKEKIQRYNDELNILQNLEDKYKAYGYYLTAVHRNGIPYYLISKALPKIESEINNILTQIVDFTIVLNSDGKNINAYIAYDEERFWPIELTSGMERFVSSLAIRASLVRISTLPRPNFIAIDEGLGVLDSDNLNNMYLLFNYLKSQFEFVLLITHIDAAKDIVTNRIELDNVNGFSRINVG